MLALAISFSLCEWVICPTGVLDSSIKHRSPETALGMEETEQTSSHGGPLTLGGQHNPRGMSHGRVSMGHV